MTIYCRWCDDPADGIFPSIPNTFGPERVSRFMCYECADITRSRIRSRIRAAIESRDWHRDYANQLDTEIDAFEELAGSIEATAKHVARMRLNEEFVLDMIKRLSESGKG